MWLLKNRSRGLYLCFVFLLALILGGSAITHADSGTASVAITGGSLGESYPTNQITLKLSKKVQFASYTLPIAVTDARGSGGGWNLMITSTVFLLPDHDGDGHKKDRLLPNASRIIGVSVACGTNSTCTGPVNNISYPLVVPANFRLPPPVKFFNAALHTGLGKFVLMMMVYVKVPPTVEGGFYVSTIILSIANGP